MKHPWICLLLGISLACGGSGGSTGSASGQPSIGSVPTISNLALNPNSAVLNEGSGVVSSQLSFHFQDPDGDVTTIRMIVDTTSRDSSITGVAGVTTGTISGSLNLPTTEVGTISFKVEILDSKGNVSNALDASFQVTAQPKLTLTSLSPSSVMAGSSGLILTASGTQFTPTSVLQWNGAPRSTTFISSSKISANITASDVANVGPVAITVSDSIANLATSNPLTFTVNPAIFSITSISPSSVNVGCPSFALSVYGAQFTPSSTVNWNGAARPTTYISASNLTAQISAADIASLGQGSVTVVDPIGQGGTTNAVIVNITRPDAVAFQINPGHSGAVNFSSVTLPAASAWSVTLDGPPSYALIASGKVFVTVPISGGSELLALDQATGAKAWGPILLSGAANAAYDNGMIFVAEANASNGIVQAFDAGTGNAKWSSVLGGYGGLGAPPTAANGYVYATSWSGALSAFDEATGALAWSGIAQYCSPAVTSDGVYITYTDTAKKLNPATGAAIWADALGGSGGGGATPVVANGLVFAPDGFGTYSGQVLNAATGALLGSYTADNPPAIGPQTGFFLQGGTLRGIALSSNTILWSFAGDGALVSSPILVNQYVFIGSSSGNLYGLDAATGTQVWSKVLAGAIPRGAGWGASTPFSGLSAGDGLLVVPAGNTLTAYTLSPD